MPWMFHPPVLTGIWCLARSSTFITVVWSVFTPLRPRVKISSGFSAAYSSPLNSERYDSNGSMSAHPLGKFWLEYGSQVGGVMVSGYSRSPPCVFLGTV